MRVVFDPPQEERPLPDLVREAELATRYTTHGRVTGEDTGFKFWHPALPNNHLFFHHAGYRGLDPGNLRVFTDLFDQVANKLEFDGIPPEARPNLRKLMAVDEHRFFVGAAVASLPADILGKVVVGEETEIGSWGTFGYRSVVEAAKKESIPVEDYLLRTIPFFTTIGDQNALVAPLRFRRPGQEGIKPQVFQSTMYGFPHNRDALRDILTAMVQSDQLKVDKRDLDDLVRNPNRLMERQIGPLVNGAQTVVSFDSDEHNKKYSLALDTLLGDAAYIRDLSPLRLAGVEAITILNKFSPLARIDPELFPYLRRIGYEFPSGIVAPNGKPIAAEGVSLVTYNTGFNRSLAEMQPSSIFTLFKSMQLGVRRVKSELPGYENASYTIGMNIGVSSTLPEVHLQGYVSKNISMRPKVEKYSQAGVVYKNRTVKVIADPDNWGQFAMQFNQETDFLERTDEELSELADATKVAAKLLASMKRNDATIYMRGNDFGVREIPYYERTGRPGFVEIGSGVRILPSVDTVVAKVGEKMTGEPRYYKELLKRHLAA